jgi:cytoplasmic iron level regulating protein YaaA (DUF328/UPF0246 family)
MMARFIVNQKPQSVSDLKEFDAAGYSYNEDLSKGNELVFCRAEQK